MFMAEATTDEPSACLRRPSCTENDDIPSSSSAATDALQAFNSNENLQDSGGSVLPAAAGEPAPWGTHSVTVTLTVPPNSPVETPPSESVASPSPMASFYVTTPSPISTIDPSPLPP